MRIGLLRFVVTCLVCLVVPRSVSAELVRAGSEFQVNVYVPSSQRYPAAGLDDAGNFVVVWTSYGRDGSFFGVFGRRYTSAGTSVATEFQVNTYTTNNQNYPAVALDGAGDFVVVWTSPQDGSGNGVFGRRFNSSGTPQAAEFQVNTYTLGSQGTATSQPNMHAGPDVAAETNGDFVVTWMSLSQDGSVSGVFAKRFDAAGGTLGVEFQVNSYTSFFQGYPSVAVDADGDFVIAWQSYRDGSTAGVFAQRFDSSGVAQAGEFQVNVRTIYSQGYPDVGIANDGAFVVTWQSYGQDGQSDGIFARRFNATGGAVGSEFTVNSFFTSGQRYPTIASRGDGAFVVTWQSYTQDGDSLGVFGRRFNSAGVPLDTEFQINTHTNDFQGYAAVAANKSGDFVVAWQSYGQVASNDIFAQRFDNISPLDIDGNGAITALTDGLLVLRFLFGFTGSTLTAGAVDMAHCMRCDAPAIQAYMQTLM